MSRGKSRGHPGEKVATAENLYGDGSLIPADPLDDLAQHLDGAFVVVVKATGGRYRRRCFLSVKAAERAARNATVAGYNAEVYLAELKPLWRLVGSVGPVVLDKAG